MSEKLNIITTRSEMMDLSIYLQDKDYVAFDTETNGINGDSIIIGMSICAEPGVGYYVILQGWDKEKQSLTAYETAPDAPHLVRELVGKNLVMHNAVFDCAMVRRNYGVDLMPSVHTDTMLLAYALDENRKVGLKDLGAKFYGEEAKKEALEMKASVEANGGMLTKQNYEMYKADPLILARYGAKDAILTFNLFYEMIPELVEEGLHTFFYEEETMPLLRSATYDLNTEGLKIAGEKLETLKRTLEIEIGELRAFIDREVAAVIGDGYPGEKPKAFNINSGPMVAWLLFEKLKNPFDRLSDAGREFCRATGIDIPYSDKAKREFAEHVKAREGEVWREAGKVWDKVTRRYKGKAKVKPYWNYLSTDKSTMKRFSEKYRWVKSLLEYKKLTKLLTTYVCGIQAGALYGIIHPSFLQHGTTSGRYSSRGPNFQNLPREDKRVKSCIVSRPGKVFVGADYSQLEPRVFASVSGDETLMNCFASGEDFYSVVGAPIFGKTNCSLVKDDPDSFAKKYPSLRDQAKVIALSTPYGRTAAQQATMMGISRDESQELIDRYFAEYPGVERMMLDSHEAAKKQGKVFSLFGRPRRIPAAKEIGELFPNARHGELPYEMRSLLNLAMNHRVQSTAASIVNRASIAFKRYCDLLAKDNALWSEVKIVLQVHDELVAEAPEEISAEVAAVLKEAMENTTRLPGVSLIAEPKIARDLAGLK